MCKPDGGDGCPARRSVHDPVGGLALAGAVAGAETRVADTERDGEMRFISGALAGCAARGPGVWGVLKRSIVRFYEGNDTETNLW